jgi:hypothetical protein
MEQELKKKPFNKRAFISIAMFLAGICLPISGIMNHRLQFEPLTVERHFWMSVLNNSGISGHFYIVSDNLIFNEAFVDGPITTYIRLR